MLFICLFSYTKIDMLLIVTISRASDSHLHVDFSAKIILQVIQIVQVNRCKLIL